MLRKMEKCPKAPKYHSVTHCIFDLDGTILDSENVYNMVMIDIAKSYHKEVPVDLLHRQLGTTTDVAAEMMISELELPITIEEYMRQLRWGVSKNIELISLCPGVEKLILHLHAHKIPIALATSSTKESTCLKFRNFQQIFRCFHHYVCGGSEKQLKSKPAPDIFLEASYRFCGNPSTDKCLVFEDAPNGVRGAKAAGMQVVMIPDPLIPIEKCKLATKVVKTLANFKPEEFGLPPYKKCKAAETNKERKCKK